MIYRCSKRWVTEKRALKPSLKRWSLPSLLEAIRVELRVHSETQGVRSVYVEEVATKLRAKKGMVDHCFMLLNKEGLISHRRIGMTHDVHRGKNSSGWNASWYALNPDKFPAIRK